jgi:hypothetical protein
MSSLTAPVLPSSADATRDVGRTVATDDGAGAEPRCRKRLLLAVVAIAGILAGAAASAILVTAAFLSAAEDIGRGMSEGFGSVRETLTHQTDASSAVDQFPAVAPGDLGEDRDLDAAAQSCFRGDLGSCDDLWTASPPMSAYEQYAATCGGRVKPEAVSACTDLE